MIYLESATASQEIPLGYFVDSTDGDTEETGLTIANTDIKLWKNGATTLANKNSGGATHISNGVYYATLDATDTDTDGPMVIFVHVAGALPVRLECHVGSIADQVWDEVLTGATHNVATSAGRRLRALNDFGLYEGGAVWIDTVNGVAGTTDFENGTVNNPVDTIADAKTIADSVGLVTFHLLAGSSITLAAAHDGYVFKGTAYTVALGGQSVSGTTFEDATITGNDDGSNAISTHYIRCTMGSSTLGAHDMHGCQLGGDLVLAEAADYFWDQCFSAVAGTGTPSVDLEAAAETKNFSLRHYSGGMEFKNFGNTGTHTASVEGHGQVVLNANCAGGTIAIRGAFTVTDNASGAVTLSEVARLDTASIADGLLNRNIATGGDGTRTVQSAFRKIRNKVAIAAGTMTVYAEDDATPDHTAAVTTAAGNPIDSVDPA